MGSLYEFGVLGQETTMLLIADDTPWNGICRDVWEYSTTIYILQRITKLMFYIQNVLKDSNQLNGKKRGEDGVPWRETLYSSHAPSNCRILNFICKDGTGVGGKRTAELEGA